MSDRVHQCLALDLVQHVAPQDAGFSPSVEPPFIYVLRGLSGLVQGKDEVRSIIQSQQIVLQVADQWNAIQSFSNPVG